MIELVRNVGDERVKISLWDTAGQERYRALTGIYFRGALGIIFVYDVNDRDSFEGLERWKQQACKS